MKRLAALAVVLVLAVGCGPIDKPGAPHPGFPGHCDKVACR